VTNAKAIRNAKAPIANRPAGIDHDSAIERYETMPAEQVNEELRQAGIDPRPTIETVRRLLDKHLARRKRKE